MLVRDILHTAYHGGEEWIGYVRNNHDYDVSLIPPEAASQLAGLISKAANRVQYSLPQFLANLGGAIDDVRHRAD